MGANAHPGAYRLLSSPAVERTQSAMSNPDELHALPVRAIRDDWRSRPLAEDGLGRADGSSMPLLWRVFAANAAVFPSRSCCWP